MKVLAILLVSAACALGQAFTLNDMAWIGTVAKPASGGCTFGSVTRTAANVNYNGASTPISVAITNTSGNMMMALFSTGGTFDSVGSTFSDTAGNSWSTLFAHTNSSGAKSITVIAYAPVTHSGSNYITLSFVFGASGNDGALTVVEYSGTCAAPSIVETDSGAAPITNIVTTTKQAAFVAFYNSENNNSTGTGNAQTLYPGAVAGTLITRTALNYSGSWEWLSSGSGFASGSYTNVFTFAAGTAAAGSSWSLITLE